MSCLFSSGELKSSDAFKGCLRYQLLLSCPYLLLVKAFMSDFRNERSCQRYNQL